MEEGRHRHIKEWTNENLSPNLEVKRINTIGKNAWDFKAILNTLPQRLNKRFRPTMLANGETVIELLTRSKYLLSVSGEKWTDRQKTRAKILFMMFPKIKEAYTLICSLRSMFSNKSIDRVAAKVKLHEWYQKVSACTLREVKAARDAIKYKEDEVLNYFINRSTNAHAESLNSKLKGFRAQLRGVQDLPFFMFRASMIFG